LPTGGAIQMVTCDTDGILSYQSIPAGGSGSGDVLKSGTTGTNYVAVWADNSINLKAYSTFTYNGTTLGLSGVLQLNTGADRTIKVGDSGGTVYNLNILGQLGYTYSTPSVGGNVTLSGGVGGGTSSGTGATGGSLYLTSGAGGSSSSGSSYAGNIYMYTYSPNALAYQGITYIGTNGTNDYGRVLFQLGAAATPAISFRGDDNTGIYHISSDNLGISTGGTLRATFNSSGITLSPLAGTGNRPLYASSTGVVTATTNAEGYLHNNGTGGIEWIDLDARGYMSVINHANTTIPYGKTVENTYDSWSGFTYYPTDGLNVYGEFGRVLDLDTGWSTVSTSISFFSAGVLKGLVSFTHDDARGVGDVMKINMSDNIDDWHLSINASGHVGIGGEPGLSNALTVTGDTLMSGALNIKSSTVTTGTNYYMTRSETLVQWNVAGNGNIHLPPDPEEGMLVIIVNSGPYQLKVYATGNVINYLGNTCISTAGLYCGDRASMGFIYTVDKWNLLFNN
jgi:hypothetical protein